MTGKHLTNAEFLRYAQPQTSLEVELYDRLANLVGALERHRHQEPEAEDRVKEMRERRDLT